MTAVLETVGLVSGVLGIWSFIDDQLPGGSGDTTTFRFGVGLEGTKGAAGGELSNAGGTIASVRLYNGVGSLIGVGAGPADRIESGDFADVQVAQGVGQQPQTSVITAGDDAVCLAYVTSTWPNGDQWGWTGDWGSICGGLVGFPSGIVMQVGEDDVDSPRCMWVDGDHTNNIEASSIGIHWPAFRKSSVSGDEASLCGRGPGFRAWDSASGRGSQLASPTKRSAPPRGPRGMRRNQIRGTSYPGRMDERLVVSPLASQNATRVCADPLNYGPDFVSTAEGVYCDMETRETMPLCGSDGDGGDGGDGDCFDLEESMGKGPARRSVGLRGRAVSKKPTKVVEYGKK